MRGGLRAPGDGGPGAARGPHKTGPAPVGAAAGHVLRGAAERRRAALGRAARRGALCQLVLGHGARLDRRVAQPIRAVHTQHKVLAGAVGAGGRRGRGPRRLRAHGALRRPRADRLRGRGLRMCEVARRRRKVRGVLSGGALRPGRRRPRPPRRRLHVPRAPRRGPERGGRPRRRRGARAGRVGRGRRGRAGPGRRRRAGRRRRPGPHRLGRAGPRGRRAGPAAAVARERAGRRRRPRRARRGHRGVGAAEDGDRQDPAGPAPGESGGQGGPPPGARADRRGRRRRVRRVPRGRPALAPLAGPAPRVAASVDVAPAGRRRPRRRRLARAARGGLALPPRDGRVRRAGRPAARAVPAGRPRRRRAAGSEPGPRARRRRGRRRDVRDVPVRRRRARRARDVRADLHVRAGRGGQGAALPTLRERRAALLGGVRVRRARALVRRPVVLRRRPRR